MKYLPLLLSPFLLSACTTTGSIKPKSELINNNQGQVVTESASLLASLNRLTTNISIGIKAIDDKKISFNMFTGYPTEATLSAGKHTLVFNCNWTIENLSFHDDDGFTKTFTIAPGQQYLVKPKILNNRECDADIEEITNEQS